MNHASLAVKLFAVCATIVFLQPLGGAAPALSPFWQHPGFEISFIGATIGSPPDDAWDPAGWSVWEATVTDVTSGLNATITVHYMASTPSVSADQTVTYSLATRRSLDKTHYAVLWINPQDVASGHAYLGRDSAILTHTDPLSVSFSTGGSDYSFDALTGTLLHVENFDMGGVASRALAH